MDVVLRWGGPSDHAALADVMFDAVRNGPSAYTEAQRAVWVPAPREGPAWTDRLSAQDVVVAEQDGEALGFMSLAVGGYVDFAYVRPGARGTGLFRAMYQRIEERARGKGDRLLWVHASLNARAAFEAMGFAVRTREEVVIGAERLERFEMAKVLSA